MSAAHPHGTALPLRTASYMLTGLECADCATQLERALANLPGVVEAGASFASARLKVVYRPEDIAEAVLFAVTAPETVHINEIMVRPAQALQFAGMGLPA